MFGISPTEMAIVTVRWKHTVEGTATFLECRTCDLAPGKVQDCLDLDPAECDRRTHNSEKGTWVPPPRTGWSVTLLSCIHCN